MKFLSSERLSEHKYKTPEGYLICTDAILARTGKQQYRKSEVFAGSTDDSIIDIDRKPEEVFSAETLASFENKPITVEHPDESVNANNHDEYAVGYVRDVRRATIDGQDVMIGNLVITDAKTIEEIERGEHTDLSCGYDCDISDDANPQQKHIRGNHVALCQQGRAGIAHIVDSIKDNMTSKEFDYWSYHAIHRPNDRNKLNQIINLFYQNGYKLFDYDDEDFDDELSNAYANASLSLKNQINAIIKDSKLVGDSIESDFEDITNMSDAKIILKRYGIELTKKDDRNYVLSKNGQNYTFYVLSNPNEVRKDLAKAVHKLTDSAIKDEKINPFGKVLFSDGKFRICERILYGWANGFYLLDNKNDIVGTYKTFEEAKQDLAEINKKLKFSDTELKDSDYFIPEDGREPQGLRSRSEIKRAASEFGLKLDADDRQGCFVVGDKQKIIAFLRKYYTDRDVNEEISFISDSIKDSKYVVHFKGQNGADDKDIVLDAHGMTEAVQIAKTYVSDYYWKYKSVDIYEDSVNDSKVKDLAIKDAGWFGNEYVEINSVNDVTLQNIVKIVKKVAGQVKKIMNGKADDDTLRLLVYCRDTMSNKFHWMELPITFRFNYNVTSKANKDNPNFGVKKLYSELRQKLKSYEGKVIYEDKTLVADSVNDSAINDDIDREKIINVAKSRGFELTKIQPHILSFIYKGDDIHKDVNELIQILPKNANAGWDNSELDISFRDSIKKYEATYVDSKGETHIHIIKANSLQDAITKFKGGIND